MLDGSPSLQCELTLRKDPEQASDQGMIATAMRVVNAVPSVCAAPPGLTSSLELGLTLPEHALPAGERSA